MIKSYTWSFSQTSFLDGIKFYTLEQYVQFDKTPVYKKLSSKGYER